MIYSSNHDSLTFFVERVFALRLQWTFSAHAATRRRTRNDGLQKKKVQICTLGVQSCTWYLICLFPCNSESVGTSLSPGSARLSLTLLRLPGQSQVTIEGRRVTRLRTWPAWAARPARASRPGALRRVWSAGTTLSAVPGGKCAPHVSLTGINTLNSANKN